MCGICGIVNFHIKIKNYEPILDQMKETLRKRGPDDSNSYISNNVLLGHRRLIVVDPLGGIQPMISTYEGTKYIIVYNGELYNTDDLRKELIEKNFKFDSYSDTEVLLKSYICFGKECFKKLNGIYALAIYDTKYNEVILARDPMGVKPLFYSIKNNTLIFGSEIKAVLKHPFVKPTINRAGLTELFSVGPSVSPGKAVLDRKSTRLNSSH